MEDNEEKELIGVSNDIYTLTETEDGKHLCFFRNDGDVIGDIGRLPMDMYHLYIANMMMSGRMDMEVVRRKIVFERSEDGKRIWLTTYKPGEKIEDEQIHETGAASPVKEEAQTPSKGRVKSLFERIFKPRKKD